MKYLRFVSVSSLAKVKLKRKTNKYDRTVYLLAIF